MDNWKKFLYKGSPIIVIIAVIIIIALILSRPKFVPQVQNPDSTVVDFKNLKVTKGELYEMMKKPMGLQVLLDKIDKELLTEMELEIDQTALEEEIAKDKEASGEEKFYESFATRGIFKEEGETQADLDEKIEAIYKLTYLKEAASKKRAEDNIDPAEITKYKEDYREDVCVITLKYDTKTNAETAITEFEGLNSEDLLNAFSAKWLETNTSPDVEEEQSYLESQLTCNYERAVYNNTYPIIYRDLVFDQLTVGDFNATPKLINNKYYVTYKVAVANPKSTYDQDKFEAEIKEVLIAGKVTQEYITETISNLRNDKGFKIFDIHLADQYKKSFDQEFPESKSKNKEAVIEFNGKIITAEELYNELKTGYALSAILNRVNYNALNTINKIKLTKDEIKAIDENITDIRTRFLASGYASMFTFEEYIMAVYGAGSVEELNEIFSLQDLASRYILGYTVDNAKVYEGVYPVANEEIMNAYNEWFSIKASHILFKFDSDDQASKDLAYTKAMQVIRGVNGDEEAYIKYDDENFVGMDNTVAADYNTVFGTIAQNYSEDLGSATKNGDLGEFGPGMMVSEFEDAAKDLASHGVGAYSLEPVESEHGYHVIYITGVTEKPEKPETYDDYTEDQIKELIRTGERLDEEFVAIKDYYTFLQERKSEIEQEHISADSLNKFLAQLRDELGFNFKDEVIQKHYEIVKEIQLSYDPNEDTTD